MPQLRVMTCNIEDNAPDCSIRHQAHDLLAACKPHVVFRQELAGAHLHGRRDLHVEANRLGLRPFMCLPQPGRSQRPTGILLDTELFEVVADEERDLDGWKSACVVTVRLRGARRTLVSAHLNHADPTGRASGARRLTDFADHGKAALIGMDSNSYPVPTRLETPLPDLDAIDDRVHRAHRSVERLGTLVPDTVPDEILTGQGHQGAVGPFVDLARHAAYALKQGKSALTPTATLTRTDQGAPHRVDRICSTPDVASTLKRVTVHADSPVRAVTDHGWVIADFDLDGLRQVLDESAT